MSEAVDRLVELAGPSLVDGYTRRLANGKVVQVKGFTRKGGAYHGEHGVIEPQYGRKPVYRSRHKNGIVVGTYRSLEEAAKALYDLAKKVTPVDSVRVGTIKPSIKPHVALSAMAVESPADTSGPAVASLREKTKGPTQEDSQIGAVNALRKATDPQPQPVEGSPDVDDIIAKHGMVGVDPYENYDGTAAVANDLDVSWLDARDHILSHAQDEKRSDYGRTAMAARVLQAQNGMDPTTPEYAEALLKTTQHGYYSVTPSQRHAWAEKIASEGIDPLQWIRNNLRGEDADEAIEKFLGKETKK